MSNSPPTSIFRREHLRHAASDGLLIVSACNQCRHREAYVAADLLAVYGDMPVENFGGSGCARCGGRDCVSTWSRLPASDDVGRLELIRPLGWQKAWVWQREYLELPLRDVPDNIDTPKSAREMARLQQPRTPPVFENWTTPVKRTPPSRRR